MPRYLVLLLVELLSICVSMPLKIFADSPCKLPACACGTKSLRMSFRTATSTATVVSTGVAAGSSQPTIEIPPKLGLLLRVQYARTVTITS